VVARRRRHGRRDGGHLLGAKNSRAVDTNG
jgi:hypothetical protein